MLEFYIENQCRNAIELSNNTIENLKILAKCKEYPSESEAFGVILSLQQEDMRQHELWGYPHWNLQRRYKVIGIEEAL